MSDDPKPRKIRGRMPAKIKVTARFVVSDTFTYQRFYNAAKAKVLADRKAKAE